MPREGHAPLLQHIGPVGDLERRERILLHQHDGDAARANVADDIEGALHDGWSQAEGGLVEQHNLRTGHQGARDRQHLLFAAGKRAGGLCRR